MLNAEKGMLSLLILDQNQNISESHPRYVRMALKPYHSPLPLNFKVSVQGELWGVESPGLPSVLILLSYHLGFKPNPPKGEGLES